MLSLIITKEQIRKTAINLMENLYDYIYDDYLIKKIDPYKLKRKYYDENIVKLYKSLILDKDDFKIYKSPSDDNFFSLIKKGGCFKGVVTSDSYEIKKDKDILLYIEDKIKNKTIEEEFVYQFLTDMEKDLKIDKDIESEIDEDQFYLKKAFFKAYELFYHDYYNFED